MRLELDHVAIVVHSLNEFVPLLERLTGQDGSPPEVIASQEVEVSFVGQVEVLQPTNPETGIARFLNRRGPGLHHIAFRVGDVEECMTCLTSEGHVFTSAEPMVGRAGHRVAFLHPKSVGGTLIELVEDPAKKPGAGG